MNEDRVLLLLERLVVAFERQANAAEALIAVHQQAAANAVFSPDAMTEAIKAAKSILRPPGDEWKDSDQ